MPALFVVLALVLQGAFAQDASALSGTPCLQTGLETVATDALDYPPGSTVYITGTGYAPGCDATIQISRPDSVVESFTATTDLEGNLTYDYLLPPPPGVIGEYGLDILGLNGMLASMTFTDGGVRIQSADVSSDPGFAHRTDVFGVGDTSYVRASAATAARGYKFEAFNAAGTSVYLGSCKTGSTAPSDSYAPTTISGSSSAQWKWVVHEWTSNNCTTGPQTEDNDNTATFAVAQPTVYSDSGLTTQQTVFGPSGTAYVVVNGFIPDHQDAQITWIKPNGSVACANTGSSDRPDSSLGGRLPDTAGSFLQFPPTASATGDVWNQNGLYDSTCLTATFAANPGTWKLMVTPKNSPDTGFTVPVFTVDTTPPTVTINQASGQADPTTTSPINFTATFSEPVTGFTGSDISFTGSTAGIGGTAADLSATVTGGPTVYNVSVTGMATRGNVVASVPAGAAQDAATNGNTASTSTDHSVTWDRVPTATVSLSPDTATDPETNDMLTATATRSDPDGDNVSLHYVWKNGTTIVRDVTKSTITAADLTDTLDLSQAGTGNKGDVITVEVTPNDNLFDGSTATDNVTVKNTPPVVALSAGNSLSPNEGSTYTYSYAISDADGDTIASVATSCGTGTKTNASNTNTSGSFDCTFADGLAGTSVSAQATDSGFGAAAGNMDTQPITVQNVAPSIAISGASNVNEGSLYTLTLGAVSDPGTDTVTSYVVHWGDGSDDTYSSNGAKTHTYADGDANRAITVDLADEDGTFLDRANAKSVAVDNVAPTVTLAGPANVEEGSTHKYTFSVSDPGDDTFLVSTGYPQCGTGGTYVTGSLSTDSSGGSFECTFPDGPATTELRIRVADSDGASDTDSEAVRVVQVANVDPIVTAPADQSSDEGDSHSFSIGSFSDPGPDSPWSVSVDWGDGSALTTFTTITTGSLGSLNHTYADGTATRTVSVTVTDVNGGTGTGDFEVDVNNVDPTATLSNDGPKDEDSPATVSFSNQHDPSSGDGAAGFHYVYSCSNGDLSGATYAGSGTSESTTCTYDDGPSDHTVKARIIDRDGGYSEYTTSVHVMNVDPTATLANDGPVDEGSPATVSFSNQHDPSSADTSAGFHYEYSCGGSAFGPVDYDDADTDASHQCTFDDGPGTHTVRARIIDKDDGFTSYTTVVTVRNVDPTATLSNDGPVGDGSPATVSFSNQHDPSSGDTAAGFHYAYSCSNGDLSGATYAGSGGSASTTCTYSDGPSNHTVRARIIDRDGGYSEYTTVVHVNDTTRPQVSINQAAGQADPTSASPIHFTAVFSEPVSGFTGADVSVGGTAGGSKTVVVIDSGDHMTFDVTISGMTDGTVVASIGANGAQDTAGNGNTGSTSTDNSVLYDGTRPSVTIDQAYGQANPTSASPIHFTAVFSEPVSGFTGSDVTFGGTAGGSKTVVVTDSGDQMTFDVAVSGMTDGTVVPSIGANGAQDAAGNGNTASTSTDNSVLYDATGPTLTVNQASGQSDPTSTSPIRFTAVFSEPVSGFQNGDVTIGGTAGGSKSASVTNPSSDGRTYDIAITGMTTSGTVVVSVDANKAQDAAGNGNAASTSTDNTVNWVAQTQNTAPIVTITSPAFGSLYAKGSANVNLSASFTDPDAGQTHTCSINWDDGAVTNPAVNETARTCSQAHTFTSAGVYTIIVTICDNAGGCGTAETWVVVYDPSAGFVTGGGWINVTPGSYPADPTLSGRANFGFNAKYQNGAKPPSGQTEFSFQVADFNFHSETYQWLVVSGFRAQFRGTGSVNGVPGYDFRLTAYDGQVSGGGGLDKFRIKITRNGQTIFDNRMGVPDDPDVADPQVIAGGSIVIHR